MNKKSNNPDIEILEKIFSKYEDILAVYLFGSHATGQIHKESDIDLAVVPKNRNLAKQKLHLLTDLAHHGFCHVDLVFLDTDDIVLKFEAVRLNRLVYQREEFDRGYYYSKIIRQYLDFYPYLKVQREAYKRHVLNGET